MKTFSYENIICKLGQNKKENWNLFEGSNPNYYFFHLSAFPSGYLIAESISLTDKLILFCAKTCKEHTKYRNIRNIKIDYCTVGNLQKAENVGEIYYISNRKVKQIIV